MNLHFFHEQDRVIITKTDEGENTLKNKWSSTPFPKFSVFNHLESDLLSPISWNDA